MKIKKLRFNKALQRKIRRRYVPQGVLFSYYKENSRDLNSIYDTIYMAGHNTTGPTDMELISGDVTYAGNTLDRFVYVHGSFQKLDVRNSSIGHYVLNIAIIAFVCYVSVILISRYLWGS